MRADPMQTTILCTQIIPNADPALLTQINAPQGARSLGILTTDCDDVSYAALDEATKKAAVRVVYAKSMYAGSSNASTALAGEFIGILCAENPEEIKSGLEAAVSFIRNDACFYSANDDDSIVYFAHCIYRGGRGHRLSDCAAGRSDCCARRGNEGGRRPDVSVLRSADGNELCRRPPHRRPGGLQGGLRGLCRHSLQGRGAAGYHLRKTFLHNF